MTPQRRSTCSGADLKGIAGLGKQLAPSEFVASMTEAELAAFIAVGRPASDPDNTQGVDMPPKGGNPSLTDQDLLDVSAYLKAQAVTRQASATPWTDVN